MKQHITVEQLAELELDLRETDKIIDKFNLPRVSLDYMDLPAIARWVSKQITIGKMIEILSSEYNAVNIDDNREFGKGYNIHCALFKNDWKEDIHKEYRDFELCDALWKAIKEVLGEVE